MFFPRTFAVLLLIALTGCPPHDPWGLWRQQPNEQLVFLSRADDAHGELYLLDRDGGTSRLTHNARHENNPALSPDGGRLAFNAGAEDDLLSWEIYVLDLATGRETRLTDNRVLDAHPDWNPAGDRLCFASFRDSSGNPSPAADIYVMNADGTDPIALDPTPWEDNDPEWSPDGTGIAFKSNRHTQLPAREEIFVMNASGDSVHRLTGTTGWQSDHDPSWSPDGRYLVFNRYEGTRPWTDGVNPDTLRRHWQALSPWNAHRVDLAGTVARLTAGTGGAGLPTCNRDGSGVLFLRLDYIVRDGLLVGADHRLMFSAPDGANLRQLLPDDRHTPTLEYYDW